MVVRPKVVFLMGPTAAGKTDAALELVERLPLEIVSVDSALVYRGMDIGTAKPAADLRARVRHHLIDIADPAESYSAGRFRRDALAAMADIRARGRVPLLVGGTLLYFRALAQGLAALPAAQPEIRARLEAERAQGGLADWHARLQALDPQAAARIHPNDAQRLQRALEVIEATGRPLSELQAATTPLDADVCKLVLDPGPRTVLHQRIAERFARMLDAGFIDEVAALRARGDLTPDHPSMRAVGYRQVWAYLEDRIDRATLLEQGSAATRQLAKRQYTWLRAEAAADWLTVDAAVSMALRQRIEAFLSA